MLAYAGRFAWRHLNKLFWAVFTIGFVASPGTVDIRLLRLGLMLAIGGMVLVQHWLEKRDSVAWRQARLAMSTGDLNHLREAAPEVAEGKFCPHCGGRLD